MPSRGNRTHVQPLLGQNLLLSVALNLHYFPTIDGIYFHTVFILVPPSVVGIDAPGGDVHVLCLCRARCDCVFPSIYNRRSLLESIKLVRPYRCQWVMLVSCEGYVLVRCGALDRQPVVTYVLWYDHVCKLFLCHLTLLNV